MNICSVIEAHITALLKNILNHICLLQPRQILRKTTLGSQNTLEDFLLASIIIPNLAPNQIERNTIENNIIKDIRNLSRSKKDKDIKDKNLI